MEDENPLMEYCDLIDDYLPVDHEFFLYDSEFKMAESFLGLAIAEAKNIEETRELLDILDTLNSHIYDGDTVLSDEIRKSLRHYNKEWIDAKEKMNSGNTYTANLIMAAAHTRLMLAHLYKLKNMDQFKDFVDDYTLEFLGKLINKMLNVAMGDVLL
ncbi:DUF1940 domain-containing protein [Acidiplasma sp.]|uniref:DUF1940 domain-containing protein n=1 Tax=Acidiplasma sp. TaxID=1872114 RepID=UPI00258FF8CE|nr:DUF1940 domain-containing protein [Acidiplasma sp.]